MTAHTVPTNEGGPKNKPIKRRFTRVYIERAVPAAAIKVEKKSQGGRRRCRGSRDRISHYLPLVDRTMPFRFIALHLSPLVSLYVESESLWALPGLLNTVQIRVALKEGFVEACTCMF